jgi:hypothetical protein
MTDEEKRRKRRERDYRWRAKNPEKVAEMRARALEKAKESRKTEEYRAKRREYIKDYNRRRWQNMTEEQKAERREQMRAYYANRLASPETREKDREKWRLAAARKRERLGLQPTKPRPSRAMSEAEKAARKALRDKQRAEKVEAKKLEALAKKLEHRKRLGLDRPQTPRVETRAPVHPSFKRRRMGRLEALGKWSGW